MQVKAILHYRTATIKNETNKTLTCLIKKKKKSNFCRCF